MIRVGDGFINVGARGDPARRERQMGSEWLREKVSTLVDAEFGGDYAVAFRHYADRDGTVGKDEVKALLRDAGVGNSLTRWAWAGAVVAELDVDRDGSISWPEFVAAFEADRAAAAQAADPGLTRSTVPPRRAPGPAARFGVTST
jgi:EF hand